MDWTSRETYDRNYVLYNVSDNLYQHRDNGRHRAVDITWSNLSFSSPLSPTSSSSSSSSL